MSMVGLPIAYPLNEEDEQKFRIYQLISMIIEELKVKWRLDAGVIYNKLRLSGSLVYLADGYDCLHTLSVETIIDDIEGIVRDSDRRRG